MEKEGLSTAEVQVIHEPLGAASCRCRRAHPSGVFLLPEALSIREQSHAVVALGILGLVHAAVALGILVLLCAS